MARSRRITYPVGTGAYAETLDGLLETLREACGRHLRLESIPIQTAAREIGIGRNTLAAWVAGGHHGQMTTIQAIATWLDQQHATRREPNT